MFFLFGIVSLLYMPNQMKIIKLLYLEFCVYKILKNDLCYFNVIGAGSRKNLGQFLINLKNYFKYLKIKTFPLR